MKKIIILLNLSVIFILGCIGSSDGSDSIDLYDIELNLDSNWDIESAEYDPQDNSGYIHLKYNKIVKEMRLSFVNESDATSDIETELNQKKTELNEDGNFIEDGNATIYGHSNAKFIIYNMSVNNRQFYEYVIIWDCNNTMRHYTLDFKDYYLYSSVSLDLSKNYFVDLLTDIKDH